LALGLANARVSGGKPAIQKPSGLCMDRRDRAQRSCGLQRRGFDGVLGIGAFTER
jgi:hypothetical protein